MGLDRIYEEVEARLADELFGVVFDKLRVKHTWKSSDWRNCDCNHCMLKRRSSHYIANVVIPDDAMGGYMSEWRTRVSNNWNKRDDREFIRDYFKKQRAAMLADPTL